MNTLLKYILFLNRKIKKKKLVEKIAGIGNRIGGEFAKLRGAINKINSRGGPSMGAFKSRLDSIFAPLFPLEKIRGSRGMATRSPNIVSLAKIRSNDFRANKQANGSCFGFIYPQGLRGLKKKI